MTLYLTEDTDPEDLAAAYTSGLITAVKLYPAGATTNSASGVRNFEKVRHVLDKMAEIGCPLCVHVKSRMTISTFLIAGRVYRHGFGPIAPRNSRVTRDHGTYHYKEWCGLCPCRR